LFYHWVLPAQRILWQQYLPEQSQGAQMALLPLALPVVLPAGLPVLHPEQLMALTPGITSKMPSQKYLLDILELISFLLLYNDNQFSVTILGIGYIIAPG
jgi:hypothetical protein